MRKELMPFKVRTREEVLYDRLNPPMKLQFDIMMLDKGDLNIQGTDEYSFYKLQEHFQEIQSMSEKYINKLADKNLLEQLRYEIDSWWNQHRSE